MVTWLSLSSWSLSGFGNNATTIFFACQKQTRANVGNSIRVMFIRASKFLERKNISTMRYVCWSREEMSNGGKLEMDSGQSNDITRCILARGLFPSSLVLVIRSVMENRIGGVTNG